MQLSIALSTMGDARRGEEAITLALEYAASGRTAMDSSYGSSLRDNALMLSLLEEATSDRTRKTLLSSLSEQAFGQRWLSTGGEQCLVPRAHSRQAGVRARRGRGTSLGAAAVGRQGADP